MWLEAKPSVPRHPLSQVGGQGWHLLAAAPPTGYLLHPQRGRSRGWSSRGLSPRCPRVVRRVLPSKGLGDWLPFPK